MGHKRRRRKRGSRAALHYAIRAYNNGNKYPLLRDPRVSKRKIINNNGKSPIENRLAKILKSQKIKFKRNQYINKYEVDFLLEDVKLVIEANGEHYHTPQKDSRKANYLYAQGYRVIQVYGRDIMMNSTKVLKRIIHKAKVKGIEL